MRSTPLLRVARTQDGVWSVNEDGPTRVAIAYFPKRWDAMKHAVKAAKAKPRARVVVLEGSKICLARDYSSPDSDPSSVEVP
jgi:hypothetical protein